MSHDPRTCRRYAALKRNAETLPNRKQEIGNEMSWVLNTRELGPDSGSHALLDRPTGQWRLLVTD